MSLNMNSVKAPSKQRQLITAGQHMARIVQVIDFGLQKQLPYQGQEKGPAYKMLITFEFPNERIDINGESRPMWESYEMKLSSHEKSTCYKWYQQLDPSNEHRGDWSKLIGKECAVLIIHDTRTKGKHAGKTFAKIAGVMPLMAGTNVPPLENDTTLFTLDSPDLEVFNAMPEWMLNRIKENLEFDNSKLCRKLEGAPTQYTARAEGDAPLDQDADEVAVETPAVVQEDFDVDGGDPWA